jgi:starch synthase
MVKNWNDDLVMNGHAVSPKRSSDRPAVLIAHPTGNQFLRNALKSLVEHQMLAEFWTTFAWNPDLPLSYLLPGGLRGQLARRAFSEVPGHQIKTTPWRELVRLGIRDTPMGRILSSGERPFSVIGIYRDFDRHVARRVTEINLNIVYAYEGGALQTFREAKARGITAVYEYPSDYINWLHKLFHEEAERNPEFADLLGSLKDPVSHLEWKQEELQLADYVFVPSEHVRQTLAGALPDVNIRVIHYGAPDVKPRNHFHTDSGKPLKVLFTGSLGQRKGIGYLLEAIGTLGSQVELTMIGRRLRPHARVDEACRRWHWHETLPYSEVLRVMQESDVLVLPSLSDAFGLVVLEAMACGLPVIVTPNTGASELIQDGLEGFVVPICSAEAIAEKLEVLHRDRDRLVEMSHQAQATAAKNSWDNYRANWIRVIKSLASH